MIAALFISAALLGPEPVASTTVGIEGRVLMRYDGAAIRGLPVNDKAAVVVRIADRADDGGHGLYDLRFIAQRAGDYDLREFLQHLDGSGVTDAAPLPVHVGALLPEDADADLIEGRGLGAVHLGGYRTALIALGVLWLVPPTWVIGRRLTRRRAVAGVDTAAPLTFADQLRPLVDAALRDRLTPAEQARLEMLLLSYWSERLGLEGLARDTALSRLHADGRAGALILAVERWLHSPRGEEAAGDATELLRPYRDVPAVALRGVGA